MEGVKFVLLFLTNTGILVHLNCRFLLAVTAVGMDEAGC